MNTAKYSFFLLALSLPFAANAQKGKDSVIHANTIEIIQAYKPEIKQAPKPEFTPALPPVDTSRPVVKYSVPTQTLYFSYHSLPLRPLALGRDTILQPYGNYVKLGGGNLSTVYLDAAVTSFKGENYESALHLHHLSQEGGIKGQKSAQTSFEGQGTLHTAGHAFTAELDVLRNSFRRYGYGYTTTLPDYSPEALTLGGFRLKGMVENEAENDYGINYKPEILISLMGGKEISSEQQLGINIPATYAVDTNVTLQLGIAASYARLSGASVSFSTGIFQLNPGVHFTKGVFHGHAIVSPTIGQSGTAYLLPDIAVGFKTNKNIFDINAGWKAQLTQNSFENRYLTNPYIRFSSSLNSQYRQEEFFGSLKTNLINHIFLEGRISHIQFYNMPLYLNDFSAGLAPGTFTVVNESMIKAISFQANVRYQVGNSFAAGLSGTWMNYYKSTSPEVWHQPGVKFKGDMTVRPLPQLSVMAYVNFLDRIYAQNELGNTVKLKAMLEIGGSAEYSFLERLSAFLTVNNLLNNNNTRWLYYPSYGFNIYGGLRFKF